MSVLRAPDFLGIGVQKAGTTWLAENLKGHPELWLPWVKELQYFNDVHIPAHRGWTQRHRAQHAARAIRAHLAQAERRGRAADLRLIRTLAELGAGEPSDEWYGRIFAHAGADQLAGEVTPEYALLPRAGLAHIRRLNPRMKAVLLLRDPIARSWSHLRMLAEGRSDFDHLSAARSPDILARADYAATIARWREAFGPETLHIETLDAIAAEPLAVLERVCGFLGVGFDPAWFPEAARPVFAGPPGEMPAAVAAVLKERLAPCYERLARILPEVVARWRAAQDEARA
ncbi:MAG: sulfotransferase [Acetobacteraceae bacterium]|nr:sulfotransferase [Acetobacteraceae bacterium]